MKDVSAPHNVDTLEARLRARLNQGGLVLVPADLPTGNLRSFVGLHKRRQIILQSAKITREGSFLRITGTAAKGIALPGLAPHILRQVMLSGWFEQRIGASELRSGFSVDAGALALSSGAEIHMQGQFVFQQDARIALRADTVPSGVDMSALKQFSRDLLSDDLGHLAVPLLAGAELTAFETDVELHPILRTHLRAELSGPDDVWQPLPMALLALRSPKVLIEARLPYEQGPNLPVSKAIAVSAHVALAGTEFDVTVGYLGKSRWTVVIEPGPEQSMPGIPDVLQHSHAPNMQRRIDQASTDMGLSAPELDAVRLSFTTGKTRLTELTLLGSVTLYDARLQLSLSLVPELSIAGRYEAVQGEKGIALSRVIADILPGSDDTFGDLRLHDLAFEFTPSAGAYSVAADARSDWHVDVAGKRIVFEELGFEFYRLKSGASGNVRARVSVAGLDFSLGASHAGPNEGWLFEGATGLGKPIQLRAFVADLFGFFNLPIPGHAPDIALSDVHLSYHTKSGAFGFSGQTEMPIDVPFLTKAHSKVHCHLDLRVVPNRKSGGHDLQGALIGDLSLGGMLFTLRYELAKERHVFAAAWEAEHESDRLRLEDVFEAMGLEDVPDLPDGLDLSLTKVQLEFDAHSKTLKLIADSAHHGTAFFVASKTSVDGSAHNMSKAKGGWGFLFGLEFTGATRLSDIPHIGASLRAADALHFTNLGLIVSSQDFSSVSLPLPPAPDPALPATHGFHGTRHFGAGHGLTLDKGVSLMGQIDIAAGGASTLQSVVPSSHLMLTTAISPVGGKVTLRATLDGDVSLDTGDDSAVGISQAGVELIYSSTIAFELFGVMSMQLQDKVMTLEPRMLISPEVIELMTDLEIEGGWDAPLGIKGLSLDEIGFELGIDILPAPGVNIGLQGACHIGQAAPKSDRFALVLELIEEVPNPLLLSFNLDEIDIDTALSVFAPDVRTGDLPKFLRSFRATDVEFFWAEKDVPLPDGTLAAPGFRFGGTFEMLGYAVHGRLAIDKTSGIEGELQLAPIQVGHILSLHGHSEGIYRNQIGDKPARLQIKPDPGAASQMQRVEVMPPNGPAMAFRTAHAPYLSGTLIASFLDLVHVEVEALVTQSGFDFKLVYDLGGIVHAELDVTLGDGVFHLYSQFGVHLKADIGPIVILGIDMGSLHLDAGFDLEMDLRVSGEQISLRIDGAFDFEGARLVLPSLHLSVAPKSLAELPGLLITHLIENAAEIFKHLFDEVGQFFEDAGAELVALGEDIAAEVTEIATAVEKEAEEIVSAVATTVTEAAEAIEADVVALGEEIEAIGAQAVQAVGEIAEATEAALKEVGAEIAHVAHEALDAIEAIGGEIAEELEAVGAAVARFAREAAAEVKEILDAVGREVARILSEARRVAAAILAEAAKIVRAIEHEAEALWHEVEHLAQEAEKLLEEAGRAIEHAAEDVFDVISKY